MKYAFAFVASVSIFAVLSAAAGATTTCSIHPDAHATATQLSALAKVSKRAATRNALNAVKQYPDTTVQSAELEAENGCLIWSFDIAVKGSKIIHEVGIDAGTGAVLSKTTESPVQQAKENGGD